MVLLRYIGELIQLKPQRWMVFHPGPAICFAESIPNRGTLAVLREITHQLAIVIGAK